MSVGIFCNLTKFDMCRVGLHRPIYPRCCKCSSVGYSFDTHKIAVEYVMYTLYSSFYIQII